MTIGVLGTGMVGKTIATKLVALGHRVFMGSRTPDNAAAAEWARASGALASHGTFADAAAFGEMVFNCTLGSAAVQVIEAAGPGNLAGKILVDVSNPLDFSAGMPPTLTVCNHDSVGETLQRAFPDVRVVKALNTVNCDVMVDPSRVPGDHDVFVSGNDADAKQRVASLLTDGFGWTKVTDLGDISTARGTEMYLPLWLRLFGALGTADFNIKLVVAS